MKIANQKNRKGSKSYINCSQLDKGMVVPNYKAMCKLLNENETTGKSKKLQEERWKRFFNYTKSGHKYIVQEVFDIPELVTDARKFKQGVYVQFIECLLIDYLSKNTDAAAILSKTQCCLAIGLMSDNFYNYSPRNDRFLDVDYTLHVDETDQDRYSPLKEMIAHKRNLSVNDNEIDYFFDVSTSKMHSILDDALKSMEKRGLIECTKLFVVHMADGFEITVESNKTELYREIFNLRQMACNILGVSNFAAVVKSRQLNRYYKVLQGLVKKYHSNKSDPSQSWIYVREYTKIFFVQDKMKKMLLPSTDKLLQLLDEEYGIELQNCRKELNHNVAGSIHRIMSRKKTEYDKAKKERSEAGWGDLNQMKLPSYIKFDNSILDKDDFLKIQTALINYLIDDDD